MIHQVNNCFLNRWHVDHEINIACHTNHTSRFHCKIQSTIHILDPNLKCWMIKNPRLPCYMIYVSLVCTIYRYRYLYMSISIYNIYIYTHISLSEGQPPVLFTPGWLAVQQVLFYRVPHVPAQVGILKSGNVVYPVMWLNPIGLMMVKLI